MSAPSGSDFNLIPFPKSEGTALSTSAGCGPAGVQYDFLALLGVAQSLQVNFLPITWQSAMNCVGRGGTAKISQSCINAKKSFAFKRMAFCGPGESAAHEARLYKALITEMIVLKHAVLQYHPNFNRFQGLCWDVDCGGSKVRPVLVFERTPDGDLDSFFKTSTGRSLAFEDRLRFCVDVVTAICSLHWLGVVHGDIKPANILVSENNEGNYVAKAADLGYSTIFSNTDMQVYMPGSQGWVAPEWGPNIITNLEGALKMDIYAFGLLCIWLLFYNIHGNNTTEFYEDTKSGQATLMLARRLTTEAIGVQPEQVHRLTRLFDLALAIDVAERSADVGALLRLLVPCIEDRTLNQTVILGLREKRPFCLAELDDGAFRELLGEEFSLERSLANLLPTDYRVRAYIAACLHERARVSAAAAFELALYYKIGFGVAKDDSRSECLLGQSRRSSKELEDRIESIRRTELYLELDSMSPLCIHNHCFNIGGFARYHSDQPISDVAELEHRRELADMEKALGADAPPVLCLRMVLAGILIAKGKFREARILRLQGDRKSEATPILEQNDRPAMGIYQIREDLDHQYRWKDPEKLNKQLLNESLKKFPEGHPDILGNMIQLASIYKAHSKWKEVEALEKEMLGIARRDLGQEHPWTLLIMTCLAGTYVVQDRWDEAEKLQMQVVKLSQEVLGKVHEQTLSSLTKLAVIYEGQKRWEEAERLHEQVMRVSNKVLGQENHHTLVCMANLAIGYKRQGRLEEAEKLEVQVTKIRSELQGSSNQYTLRSMKHLAVTYRAQGRWKEAIKLDIRASMNQIRATCRFKLYDLRMCWWSRPWWCRWTEIRRIFQSRTKSAQG